MPRPAERVGETIAEHLPLDQMQAIANGLRGLLDRAEAAGEIVIEVRVKLPPRAREVQT